MESGRGKKKDGIIRGKYELEYERVMAGKECILIEIQPLPERITVTIYRANGPKSAPSLLKNKKNIYILFNCCSYHPLPLPLID